MFQPTTSSKTLKNITLSSVEKETNRKLVLGSNYNMSSKTYFDGQVSCTETFFCSRWEFQNSHILTN